MGHRREVRGRRKNGEVFPGEATVSRQTVDGKTILTVVHRDITERKELEELREAAADELAHRMRNLLSVVNSLISLTAASAVTVEEFKESLTGRMRALAVSQSALRLGEHSTSLSELFRAELAQYQTSNGANVTIEVASVPVGPRAAQMLALAVHELATNSAKYGALSSVGGCVAVTSALQGEGDKSVLVIKWRETGGPPVSPPTRQGFGTTLLRQVVARALRADVALEYRPEGLICRMTLPTTTLEADH
jgi:two-component sensor histidine kinase